MCVLLLATLNLTSLPTDMLSRASLIALALCVSVLVRPSAAIDWPEHAVAWWYVPDNNWPQLIEQVAAHRDVVTSVMVGCGPQVSDSGNVTTAIDPNCFDPETGNGTLPALAAIGVRPEIWFGAGNCSIDSYRLMWSDTVNSVQTLVDLAQNLNISGWNMDFEPQSDNCQGVPTGDAADAVLYAKWLAALRAALNPIGVRVTADVAMWSPAINQFAVLAPSVDRLFDMDTYNADSLAQWLSAYDHLVNPQVPLGVAGVGLGCWVDGGNNNTWSVTAESATERIAQIKKDNVPEIGMFRLLPQTYEIPPAWPESFWWDALASFTDSSRTE